MIGDGFGAALTQDGNVYNWGENHAGQLGTGDKMTKVTPWLNISLE